MMAVKCLLKDVLPLLFQLTSPNELYFVMCLVTLAGHGVLQYVVAFSAGESIRCAL